MVKASLLWEFWNLESDVFVSPIEKEVKKFESLPEASKDDDILKWWKFYSEGLPILFTVAIAILAIPASGAKTERVFSTSGNWPKILSPQHAIWNFWKSSNLKILFTELLFLIYDILVLIV